MKTTLDYPKDELCVPPMLMFLGFKRQYFVHRCLRTVSGCHFVQKRWKTKAKPYLIRMLKPEWCGNIYIFSLRERTISCHLPVENFRVYLLSLKRLSLKTDHQALKTAFQKKYVHCCLARWLEILSRYFFVVSNRLGRNNQPADYLSRLRNPMNKSEKIVEVQVPHGNEYESNLQGLMKFFDGQKMREVDLEQKNSACKTRQNFAL